MIDALGHYKILSQLGTGGMGDVFRARDTILGRTVIIKVIPRTITADPERRARFLQDARAAATLSHPNIATLFEIREEGSHLFLVFEYVPGQPLRKVISGRPLNIRSALDIAIQLVDALAEAHARGVAHRDIKPANIVVNPKGPAKFLDFGLVAWTEEGASSRAVPTQLQNASAIALGTVAYLSPEQAVGEPVDHRADLFSLAVILFEMLTGRAPFAERAASATVVRIAPEAPAAPSGLNPDVPPELDAILLRALANRLDDRYQSAASFAAELRSAAAILDIRTGDREPPAVIQRRPAGPTWPGRLAAVVVLVLLTGAGAWTGQDAARRLWWRWFGPALSPVIAVLPFDAGETGRDYFASGLTEDLLTRLGQIPGLKVVGRSSMREYSGMDLRTMAAELDAAAVMTGSVRPGSGQIRLEAELVEPQGGVSFWSGQYTSEMSQVFAVQTELAEATARALGITLEPSAARARKKSHVVDARAYDLYMRAQDAAVRRDTAQAIEFYELALAEEGGLAEANAGLAQTLHLGVLTGEHADDSATEMRIQRAATRAVATDPDLPQAQLAQGLAAASLLDALTSLRRAIDLDPSFAEGYDQIGRQIIELDPVLALRFFEKALELDPFRDLSWMNRVSAHAVLDRFEEAEEAISRGRERWPDQTGWSAELARIEFEQHRYEAGLQLVQEGTTLEVSLMSSVVYADALYMSGQRTEALGLATRTAARAPSFCEGRATVAALRFAAGDRIAARSLANDIFEEADHPNAARSAARCAALVAAGISDPTRAAEWLRRIAADEAALRAWIRHVDGISGRMALRRGWFPWSNVTESREIVEATERVEEALTVLQAEAALVLEGILD